MKTILFTITLTVLAVCAFAQTNKQKTEVLIDRGVALNDSGKYAEAIEKYKEAIRLDSLSSRATFEISYTLFSSGHGIEAIPYLEKTLKLSPGMAGAYDLLGSIYDDNKNPEKAIEYYLKGIKADPNYQRLYFNLAIAYYRNQKYKESEESATTAIKLDPKHASSQRIYAMATYQLNKRGNSLLAWCSFLILEPQSRRSPEAVAYVRNIVNQGIKKTGEKSVTLNADLSNTGNTLLQLSVVNATDSLKKTTAVDTLQHQLKAVFACGRELFQKNENEFVLKYLGDYFEKLGKSDIMPAFTRYITVSVYKDDNLPWFKANDDKLKVLDLWIRTTERNF